MRPFHDFPNVSRARRRRHAAIVVFSTAVALALVGCTAAPDAGHTAGSPATTAVATPAVASVSSAVASVVEQQTVTITGRALGKVKTVQFGSQAAEITGKRTADKLTVTAPAAANYQPTIVPVTLLDGQGKPIATKPAAYAYTASSGVAKQLEYALTYWKSYNTAEYGDLNPVGGDCANFVSQTLVARGWTMNDEWYNHDAAGDWSPAWGYVPAMDDYFASNAASLGLQEFNFDQRSQIAVGDIVVFEWNGDTSPDHVQVVTKVTNVNGTIKIEMASHNDDYDFRDLDNEITVEHPGATGHFWHLTR
ncbi:amidase domain-containing protein [Rathayibacter soli]|uniref:amidase domain-containing protein n=1 Tax=Rathayibacter soli TaxID=3144168 RepID=UPI0027E40014|nr:amidase domain-containing protein [Glaciibacter superstes]